MELEPWRRTCGLGEWGLKRAQHARLLAQASPRSNVPPSNRHVGVVQTPWGHRRMWRLVFCLQLLVYIDRRGRLSANGQ